MEQIKVSHLSKIYNQGQDNEVRALDDVSFTLNEGEFVVILGASGAGKSTLLNLLGGMDNATSGEYLVAGEDIAKYKSKKLALFRRQDIGFVFQFYNLMPNLTALENIELAASVAKNPFDARDILKRVGLEKRANNFPSQLSGGEQQRVCIVSSSFAMSLLALWIVKQALRSSSFSMKSRWNTRKPSSSSPITARSPNAQNVLSASEMAKSRRTK